MIPEAIFLSPKGLRIKILIAAGSNRNSHSKQFQQNQNVSRSTFKVFKVPTLSKNKKEEDKTKKWKKFSLSLNTFELDDVSDLKIIDKFVLKLLMSLRVSQEYGVLQLSY